MLACIFLRRGRRFRLSRRRGWNNGLDFVFSDQLISIVGLDFEHVIFVGHDYAIQFPAALEANLIRPRRNADRGECQNKHRKQRGAALIGDSHIESIPPLSVAGNLHTRGGVRRATSASSALKRPASRSTSSIAALSRARTESGNCTCVCCSASASAIKRICLLLRGFNRSQSRRLLLRFRPSHSSPVPAGRPFSGSVAVSVFCFLAWIIFNSSQRSPLLDCSYTNHQSRVTSHESPITSHEPPLTSSTPPASPH